MTSSVWTGGFKDQFTNIWTWCKRYNPTPFGLVKIDSNSYNYSENHEAFNVTDIDACSKLTFSFAESESRCVEAESKDIPTVCESTSNVTTDNLVS